ncbi:MAG: hypothetical protein QXN24_05830 [Candidatus Bathyarchaeia archaeon]
MAEHRRMAEKTMAACAYPKPKHASAAFRSESIMKPPTGLLGGGVQR